MNWQADARPSARQDAARLLLRSAAALRVIRRCSADAVLPWPQAEAPAHRPTASRRSAGATAPSDSSSPVQSSGLRPYLVNYPTQAKHRYLRRERSLPTVPPREPLYLAGILLK